MKLFLLRMVAFVFFLLALNLVFLAMVEKLYFQEYRQVDLGYDQYLLADSHGVPLRNSLNQYGIYNFSLAGDSYADMYAKTRYLLNHTALDTLYISVDDHMLSSYREVLDNAARSVIYKTPEDFDNYYDYFVAKYIKRYIVYFNSSYRDIINTYLRSVLKKWLSKSGAISDKTAWNELSYAKQKAKAQARFKQQYVGTATSDALAATLQKIIDLCQQHNVVVVGVKFPLTKAMLDVIGEQSYGADAYFREQHLPVYDFRDKYQQHDNYFSDEDHLNEQGGALFARDFSRGQVIGQARLLRRATTLATHEPAALRTK